MWWGKQSAGTEQQQRPDVQLSERLASLGIEGGQFRGPWYPPDHHNAIVLRGFRGALDWVPIMPWDANLSVHQCNFWQSVHWKNYTSISFHIEWDMIVCTVFLSILNQIEFHLVHNQIENCHHDHIPFNVKRIGNIDFSVHGLPKITLAVREISVSWGL